MPATNSGARPAAGHDPAAHGERWFAALSYLGGFGLLAWAVGARGQFAARHNRLANGIHLARLGWVGAILAVWWLRADDILRLRAGNLLLDLGMLLLAGIPMPGTFGAGALTWILWPLAVCWVVSLTGFVLSSTGHTADAHAFIHADWSDVAVRRRWLWRNPEEERRQARAARDRQIERLQKTNRAMTAERTRRDRMDGITAEIERLWAQKQHNDRLLSLGEISRKRYQVLQGELDAESAALREELAEYSSRVVMATVEKPARLRIGRLDRDADSRADTVAFVTPSGVPIFTYGQFQLDEALVAGMLSAFDSLSEEVFGSRVHKTELAEGQVMHFVHGQHIIVVAIFEEEPSPRQIEQLRTMLQHFEQANAGPLARQQYEPRHLHEAPIPFRFQERLRRGAD